MISIVSLGALIGFLIFGITVINASTIFPNYKTPNLEEKIMGQGEVIYIDLEGGFFGIISNDGKHFNPINLPPEYKIDGLKVFFEAIIRNDLVSFYMWGYIIELINIRFQF